MTPFTVSPSSQSYQSSTAIVGVHVQTALPCLWKQKRMERGSWTILLYCIFKINYINYHAHFWLKGSKQMTGGVDENLKLFHGLTPRRPWDLQVGRVDSVFTLLPFNFLLAVCGWPSCGTVTPPLPAETQTHTDCLLPCTASEGRPMNAALIPASFKVQGSSPIRSVYKSHFYCVLLMGSIWWNMCKHRRRKKRWRCSGRRRKNNSTAVAMIIVHFHVDGEEIIMFG